FHERACHAEEHPKTSQLDESDLYQTNLVFPDHSIEFLGLWKASLGHSSYLPAKSVSSVQNTSHRVSQSLELSHKNRQHGTFPEHLLERLHYCVPLFLQETDSVSACFNVGKPVG